MEGANGVRLIMLTFNCSFNMIRRPIISNVISCENMYQLTESSWSVVFRFSLNGYSPRIMEIKPVICDVVSIYSPVPLC